jgi:hypothetical protein
MGHGYRICGIDLDSPVELCARPLPRGAVPRIHIELGEDRPIPFAAPPGRVVAKRTERNTGHILVEQEDGYVHRIYGLCDFAVDKSITTAHLSMSSSVGRDFAAVLLGGTLVTTLALLDGGAVVHAGAVEWNGLTIAVAGASGAGKSTSLALMCAQGAKLLAEDALRLDIRDDSVWGLSGCHEVRLRPRSLDVASLLNVPVVTTPDARYSLRVPSAGVDSSRLDIVVFPEPSEECDQPSFEILTAQDALFRLLSYPRISGLCDQAAKAASFRSLARLAAHAPTVVARLPWGPPFPASLGAELLSSLERIVRPELAG